MLEIAVSNNNITDLFKINTYSFHKQSIYKQRHRQVEYMKWAPNLN